MIQIGNAEAILQLSIALNLAYFSFREIRTPSFTEYQKYIDKLKNKISDLYLQLSVMKEPNSSTPLGDKKRLLYGEKRKSEFYLNMHQANILGVEDPYSENMYSADNFLRIYSIIVATLGVIFLYFISIDPKYLFHLKLYTGVIFFFFSPTILSVIYNLLILHLLKQTRKYLNGIEKEIHDIEKKVAQEYIPMNKKIKDKIT